MRTRSSSNLHGESSPNPTSSNPKHHNRRRSKQPFILKESLVDTMADQRTMAELLRAPTEGYAEAIVVPSILAKQFELKHSLINMMNSDQFFRLEKDNPYDHIRWFNKITSTIKYKCLAANGNTFPEVWDNIQGYVAAAVVNYNQEETLMDQDLAEYTIKVLPPLVQKSKPQSQRNFVMHQKDPLHPNIPYPSRMHKQKQQEKDEKMLKALLSNKEKLLELANTTLNENYSAIILKKLPEKLGDPGKFLIPCGFSLPELISTRMTLELANREICTPAGIARDVFVPVGKFTFPADFIIVDYESDPRVSLILGRPFLQIARALIDVHGEEMILRDGDERLTLNMRHDTSSYSNQPQKESINNINIYDDSCEDFLKDLFATNLQSGSPTFSSYPNLTSSEVKDDIFELEGSNVLIEKLLDLDSTKDLPPPHNINPLSKSTTSSSPNHLLEEFADELALITFPPGNDDLPIIDPIKEMDSILEDSIDEDNLANLNDNLVDTMPEMFIDEHALDYSSLPLYNEYDDDLFEVESDTEYVYDDPFDSKGEKIKESKLLIDELDLLRLSDFLPSPEYYSFLFKDFFKVDALPSTDNKDKVFNLSILIQENPFEVNTHVAPDKNAKKIAISHASLILKDFDPPPSDYELPFHKEVLDSKTLLSFSSENKEKVFKPGILTSKEVYSSLLPKLSHRGPKVFKIIKILEIPMELLPCSFGEDIRPYHSQPTAISIDLLNTLLETCTTLTRKVKALEQDKIAQALEIKKLKQKVRRLEKKGKLKVSGLKRLRKVGTTQRVKSSADTGRQEESQAQVYHLDLEHAGKVLSMQDDEIEPAELKEVIEVVTTAKLMTEVVIVAATTITAAPSASRRRKGVVIRDPEEIANPSIIVNSEPKSKDKGKVILNEVIEQVKRKEKQDNTVLRYQALKRKPQTEAQAKKNMMVYLKNMAGFKMDFFKGISYDDISPIFEKHFNSIMAFLAKGEEELEEEASKALKRKSESFEQEDLEMLWQIVQERFASSKPKNFLDDFLLNTLKTMFEKPNVNDHIWKNQRGSYGLAKVKS
uniref:Reverse transcriptase domain-containing protein n=1 Tax=Tanacetum cinerariifolium TaxID=118510 RepID=A0A6L2K1R5_TANCI|nr:hypothetical protein [Tanacetum cinerariifolium]